MPRADRKRFLLAHWQAVNFQLCVTVRRLRLFIGFPLTIIKPLILKNLEEPGNIKQICALNFSSKPDTSASSVTMVKSHGKKYQRYFRVTASSVTEM